MEHSRSDRARRIPVSATGRRRGTVTGWSGIAIRMMSVLIWVLMSSGSISSAQTVFTDAGLDSYIANQANWSAGLPTNGVIGTIGIDAEYDSDVPLVGYSIVHTNGTVSKGTGLGSLPINSGTTWEQNGAATVLFGRGVKVDGGTYTLNQGTADLTDNNRDSVIDGDGDMIINSGVMTVGRNLGITHGNLTVNGGSVTANAQLGGGALGDVGVFSLNGGTVTTPFLYFANDDFRMNVGGTNTAGALVITNFGSGRAKVAYIDINFDYGSLGSIQLTDPVESGMTTNGGNPSEHGWSLVGSETGLPWAEALWGDGRLTYRGSNSTQLGDWSVATNYNGLGDFYRFNFVSNTLSLAWEPPPQGTVIRLY